MVNKKRHRSLIIFGVLLGVLIAVLFLFIYIFLSKSIWDFNARVNIALNSKPVIIFSYDPNRKTLNGLAIPSDINVETVFGYGIYRMDKLFRLDEQEKKNGQLFTKTLSKLIGIPIDAYIKIDNWPGFMNENLSKEDFIRLKNYLNSISLPMTSMRSSRHDTNFISDFIRGILLNFGIKTNNVAFINLKNYRVFSSENSSGEEHKLADIEKLDETLKNYFYEEKITDENLNIEILNSTEKEGLAEIAARVATNIGGKVINTGNFNEPVFKCSLYTSQENKISYTVTKLKLIFNCNVLTNIPEESRADISLVLGSEYQQVDLKN